MEQPLCSQTNVLAMFPVGFLRDVAFGLQRNVGKLLERLFVPSLLSTM